MALGSASYTPSGSALRCKALQKLDALRRIYLPQGSQQSHKADERRSGQRGAGSGDPAALGAQQAPRGALRMRQAIQDLLAAYAFSCNTIWTECIGYKRMPILKLVCLSDLLQPSKDTAA